MNEGRTVRAPVSLEECYLCRDGVEYAPTWRVLTSLMDYPVYHAKFNEQVYRQAVFIGERKAYVAPWSPTTVIYLTMKALINLGYLDREFEKKMIMKHNALEIYDVVATERLGNINDIAFNFYKVEGKGIYEALAIFWTESDEVARGYAFKLYAMPVPTLNI